jgi:hypothetical protein
MSIQKAVFAVLVITSHHMLYIIRLISYTKFHTNWITNAENMDINFILFPFIKTAFLLLIVTKLANTQQFFVDILCTRIYPDMMKNAENTKIFYYTLNQVQLMLNQFSQISHLIMWTHIMWTPYILYFTSRGQEI